MNAMGRWPAVVLATIGLFVMTLAGGCASSKSVLLAENGTAQAVIVVPADWQTDRQLPQGLPPQAAQRLKDRQQLFRDSVQDLSLYLGRMSGTEIETVTALPKGDRRTPIYVDAAAEAVFGPVGISKADLFGFRVVADPSRGIGLYGESQVGTSYAIYELLHRLGCRWFMPTDIGEVVPNLPVMRVPVMDAKLAPATEARTMSQGGADFLRRNRMGFHGNTVWLAEGDGSFDRFFTKEERDANPDWTHQGHLRLVHPGVANHIANKILAQLDAAYEPMREHGLRPGYSIVPPDGQVPTEDPMAASHDPDPRVWEPAAGRWSVTDRCILMLTRIAEKVRAKYPDVAFGDQAYVNKSYPPARHEVPEDFRIVICPIDFNRFHPMDWPNHPNEYWLRDMVQGWAKSGAAINAYWYGINLAEISAPCPFITKWGTDIAMLLENNLQEWAPETMNGWDSMLPAYVLASRMTFYPSETPQQILDDLWTKFYGAAAEPMARYWTGIDKAYLEARQYAGSPFGYLKIFTPEVMKAARADIDEALAKCQTVDEYRRVLLIDESFGLFEWYMKMRNDWAQGKVADLEADYAVWRNGIRAMQRKYGVIDRFARDGYTSWGICHVQGRHGNPNWNDQFVSLGYINGARMEREFARHGTPMLEWKWQHNPGPEADALPWTAVDHDDSQWPTTHVVRDTWSSLGHHLTMTDEPSGRSGRMAYRATQKLPAPPEGKKVYLWIGSTDGTAKVYVNGKLIPFGDGNATFSGYCRPAQFDITAALKEGDNQFTILCDRHHLNELGTGGLMGPVMLYREK
jgi:hypothetical protein